MGVIQGFIRIFVTEMNIKTEMNKKLYDEHRNGI